MAETSRLLAVAKDFQRFVLFRRRDEAGQHHAVTPGLARTDGVEQPRDDDRQIFFPRVGQREKFVGELRAGVTPARLARRADEQIVVLAELRLRALAINFRGRGQQQRRAVRRGGAQQNLRFVEACLQNVQRRFDDQFNADGRRQMKNKFRICGQFRQFGARGNFGFDRFAAADSISYRAQIFQPAGREIVNDDDAFAVVQQAFNQMRADEARATGDEDMFHSQDGLNQLT